MAIQEKYQGTRGNIRSEVSTLLRVGDRVMVIAGGNPRKNRELKGKVGKILRFLPKKGRVVVEGLNMIRRHKKKMSTTDAGGMIVKEGSIHLSNVMYYSDEAKRPFRLKTNRLADGKKVRGYTDPKTKKFEQI